MSKYDYMIAGRWRNRKTVERVLAAIRDAGRTAYCFIENAYDNNGIVIDTAPDSNVDDFMSRLEMLEDWQTNSTFREIFENDMNGIRDAREFVLVFPAGASAHMELGAAYGMGKKCYAIGEPEKAETLYLMLDKIYPDTKAFLADHGRGQNED